MIKKVDPFIKETTSFFLERFIKTNRIMHASLHQAKFLITKARIYTTIAFCFFRLHMNTNKTFFDEVIRNYLFVIIIKDCIAKGKRSSKRWSNKVLVVLRKDLHAVKVIHNFFIKNILPNIIPT